MRAVVFIICLAVGIGMYELIAILLANLMVDIMFPYGYSKETISTVAASLFRTLYAGWWFFMMLWAYKLIESYIESRK